MTLDDASRESHQLMALWATDDDDGLAEEIDAKTPRQAAAEIYRFAAVLVAANVDAWHDLTAKLERAAVAATGRPLEAVRDAVLRDTGVLLAHWARGDTASVLAAFDEVTPRVAALRAAWVSAVAYRQDEQAWMALGVTLNRAAAGTHGEVCP